MEIMAYLGILKTFQSWDFKFLSNFTLKFTWQEEI